MIGQKIQPRPRFSGTDRAGIWRQAGMCLLLAAMVFAVFGQTLSHDFVNLDDNDYVYANPVVARGLTAKGIAWAFDGAHAYNWHPLTWLSHLLDCQVYDLHPGGHHLTNVLLHTLTTVVLFLVLRQLTGAFWRSAFVAAVFAVHPLRVESVAWISERKDVLSGLFFVLTLGAYVRYVIYHKEHIDRREGERERTPGMIDSTAGNLQAVHAPQKYLALCSLRSLWLNPRYGVVLLLIALGLMAKPMLVTLPVILLLLDYWPLRRNETFSKLFLEKLPLFALSAVSCVITILGQHDVVRSTDSFALSDRLGNALVTSIIYLRQMVWPANLALPYLYSLERPGPLEICVAALLFLGLCAIAIWQRRERPWLLVGWAWYLVMLLPVIGLVQVGPQAHADRYTYLPQIGIYLAIAWLAVESGVNKIVLGTLSAAAVAALMCCARKQTAYWQNSETLWRHTLQCEPGNYIAHYSLGDALLQRGDVEKAIEQYQITLELNPRYSQARNSLGTALRKSGKLDQAVAQYREALALNPRYGEAFNNLGVALRQQGKFDDAVAAYQSALEMMPDNASIHFNLANLFLQKRDAADAIRQYAIVLAIDPSDAETENNLAWLLATAPQPSLRNGAEAMRLATRANEQYKGTNATVLSTLAAALAETGHFTEAAHTTQKAIDLAQTTGQKAFLNQLTKQLQQYRVGQPLHQ